MAGISVILGTLVTTMLPHFFSHTAPPPLASPRTPGQDAKDAESALMKSPSTLTEGLNQLDTSLTPQPCTFLGPIVPTKFLKGQGLIHLFS